MIYLETGLHYHLTEAKVTYTARIAWLVYKTAEELTLDSFETFNLLFKDHSQDDWSSLKFTDLMASFTLLCYCFKINLFVLYMEYLFSFLLNYSI